MRHGDARDDRRSAAIVCPLRRVRRNPGPSAPEDRCCTCVYREVIPAQGCQGSCVPSHSCSKDKESRWDRHLFVSGSLVRRKTAPSRRSVIGSPLTGIERCIPSVFPAGRTRREQDPPGSFRSVQRERRTAPQSTIVPQVAGRPMTSNRRLAPGLHATEWHPLSSRQELQAPRKASIRIVHAMSEYSAPSGFMEPSSHALLCRNQIYLTDITFSVHRSQRKRNATRYSPSGPASFRNRRQPFLHTPWAGRSVR